MKHFDFEPVQTNGASPAAKAQQKRKKALIAELLKTAVFALAALTTLVAATIAWFVSNNLVQSGTSTVSAGVETVKLASTGKRQEAESAYLRVDGASLPEGNKLTVGGTDYYSTDGNQIALRLSQDHIISPGASGKVTFYIIPTHDGETTVTLYLGLAGYALEGTPPSLAERVSDDTLDALLSGHILLFNRYEDEHYSDWLFQPTASGVADNVITVTLPAEAQKDVPYPVTLYWIWPLRYDNMLDDLYAENSQEYQTRFAPFLEEQAEAESMGVIPDSDYRYSRLFLTNEEELGTSALRSKAYNLADEYIGTNADFLYLTIQTSPAVD